MTVWEDLSRQLEERELANLKRHRHVVESAQGAVVLINGDEKLCFCSNDYLGFANHPLLVGAVNASIDRYGVGGGASHLVCGHSVETP